MEVDDVEVIIGAAVEMVSIAMTVVECIQPPILLEEVGWAVVHHEVAVECVGAYKILYWRHAALSFVVEIVKM